ncbi:MAG: hypothetical protein IJY35_12060 [Clostridia bacterium]|nr:hypothetical protein [Clostridia bacterium]
MKKKILCITGGICGVLLIVSLILTVIPAAKAYSETGNLLVLHTEDDITAALDATGIPHSAEETAPGVWEIRSRHELIPMLHELMKDKGDAEPVYEAAQERMFVLIVALWLIFTAVCLTVAFMTKRYVRWTAFALAFLGCLVCTMVFNEVICRIPIC